MSRLVSAQGLSDESRMVLLTATEADIPGASACFADAFAADPVMAFFFPGSHDERQSLVREFFALLMSARISLGMPALLMKDGQRVVGAVMGYDTRQVDWPSREQDQWALLERKQVGMAERFGRFDEVTGKFKPNVPHYYLGALCVHPSMQGRGIGRSLIEAYCQTSANDSSSAGIFLETGKHQNVSLYRGCGFDLLGRAELDSDTPLWCMYRAALPRSPAAAHGAGN